jgi:hypothetical protein
MYGETVIGKTFRGKNKAREMKAEDKIWTTHYMDKIGSRLVTVIEQQGRLYATLLLKEAPRAMFAARCLAPCRPITELICISIKCPVKASVVLTEFRGTYCLMLLYYACSHAYVEITKLVCKYVAEGHKNELLSGLTAHRIPPQKMKKKKEKKTKLGTGTRERTR